MNPYPSFGTLHWDVSRVFQSQELFWGLTSGALFRAFSDDIRTVVDGRVVPAMITPRSSRPFIPVKGRNPDRNNVISETNRPKDMTASATAIFTNW